MPRLTAAFLLTALSAALSAAPAFAGQGETTPTAQDSRLLVTPAEAPARLALAPAALTEAAARAETEQPFRVFSQFAPDAPLTRMDQDKILAEIEARFGRAPRVEAPETGLVFRPDPSMVFKPLGAAGRLRDPDIAR
ncbi:MAG: hypothetical protein WBG08_11670 [Litorimonas sp.]